MSYMEMQKRLQELDRLAKTASNSHASRCEPKKLIDANSIQYHKTTECHGHGLFFTEQIAYKEEIEQIPAVDAVEVVRCRFCKKWNRETGACSEFASHRLPTGGRIVFLTQEADFCSFGERRDSE